MSVRCLVLMLAMNLFCMLNVSDFSSVLAQEGKKDNITSNVIAPIALTRMTEGIMDGLGLTLDPEYVTAMVCYLASEQCELTHEIFSVGAGRYARVFVGLCKGWADTEAESIGADDVAAHIDEIRDPALWSVREAQLEADRQQLSDFIDQLEE